MSRPGNTGFSLLELVFAISVIAILTVIAYPSYHNSIRKSRRVDAQQALMEAAHKLENYYAKNASYTADLRKLGYPDNSWNTIQSASATAFYKIRVNNPVGCNIQNCFLLESQNIGDQQNDVVNSYRLWSTGRKQVRVNSQEKEGW
ncbi:MAG: type IV pilin protein [Arenicellales bacterium]